MSDDHGRAKGSARHRRGNCARCGREREVLHRKMCKRCAAKHCRAACRSVAKKRFGGLPPLYDLRGPGRAIRAPWLDAPWVQL